FTDGNPTAITADMRIKSTSPCVQKPLIRGVIASNEGETPSALFSHVGNGLAPNSAGCAYTGGAHILTDFRFIPDKDIWGNSLATSYKTNPQIVPDDGVPYDGPGGGTSGVDRLSPTDGDTVVKAATNAADEAGRRIRSGGVDPVHGRSLPGVVIYSIGLGSVTPELLMRISNINDASNTSYDSNLREGMYLHAPEPEQLEDAFNRIASEILRLAQ
ncbi:MAG: hypothetical protein ACRD7E_11840, partial [Bryobacteraceae bacterium]